MSGPNSRRAQIPQNLPDSTPIAGLPDSFQGRLGYESRRLPKDVAATVRSAMRAAGYSQQDLAREMAVSDSRVSQILSGEENLTLRTLAALGAALRYHFVIGFAPFTPSDSSGNPLGAAVAAVAATNAVDSIEDARTAVAAAFGVTAEEIAV